MELISGEINATIQVASQANYIKLLDLVQHALGYEVGKFSLW